MESFEPWYVFLVTYKYISSWVRLLYSTFDQVLVWAGADFGTDIGKCHLICPVVSTEESVFENYYIAKGSFPGKDQASQM